MENHQTPAGASVYTIQTNAATAVTDGRSLEWRRERAASLSDSQRKRADARRCMAPLELRDGDGDGIRILRSYASLFNVPYIVAAPGFRFQETAKPGAFKRSLGSGPDVVFRTEHSGPPLGVTWNNTLRLGEDKKGFWYEVDLNERDPDAQALLPKVVRRDYRESSFAFRTMGENGDSWNDDRSERDLLACDIHRGDVSVVTFGASPQTGDHMTLRSEVTSALDAIGLDAIQRTFAELREERIGRMISTSSMDVLNHLLDLFARADVAVDEGQAVLSDLMGVPNPDSDADADADEDDGRSGGDNIGGGPSGLEVRLAPNDTDELRLLREYRATRSAR